MAFFYFYNEPCAKLITKLSTRPFSENSGIQILYD